MEYIVRRHMEGGYYFRYHSFGTEIEAKKYIDERLGMEVKSTVSSTIHEVKLWDL